MMKNEKFILETHVEGTVIFALSEAQSQPVKSEGAHPVE